MLVVLPTSDAAPTETTRHVTISRPAIRFLVNLVIARVFRILKLQKFISISIAISISQTIPTNYRDHYPQSAEKPTSSALIADLRPLSFPLITGPVILTFSIVRWEFFMARKRYSDEDILKLLREIELNLAAGSDVATACRG